MNVIKLRGPPITRHSVSVVGVEVKKKPIHHPIAKLDKVNANLRADTPNFRRGSKRQTAKRSNRTSIAQRRAAKSDDAPRLPFGGIPESRRGRLGAFVPASFTFTVRTHDIAGGVQQLRNKGSEASWIVFLFDTARVSEKTTDQSLALQYSVMGGRVGLDWVLLGPRNVADKLRVAAFMRHRGHEVKRLEMNQVEFLRVEDGDLAVLGVSILRQLYGLPPSAELGLLIDGIVLSTGKRTIL